MQSTKHPYGKPQTKLPAPRKARLTRILLAAASAAILALPAPVTAQEADPPPERRKSIEVSYTEHTWWLTRWSDNEVLCQVLVEGDDRPDGHEIFEDCGEEVYEEWADTESCPAVVTESQLNTCEGVYLQWVKAVEKQREVEVELPPASVWVSLSGCSRTPPDDRCDRLPALMLSAEEPLPNEAITFVRATVDGILHICEGATCEIPLAPTGQQGANVMFWAESSFGDLSPHYAARVRVLPVGSFSSLAKGWYVDVLSTQWRETPPASCSLVWDAFPPPGGVPDWLSTPESVDALASAESFVHLADMLIIRRAVDVSQCPAGGLLEGGTANACALKEASPAVQAWQNQFDHLILEVAEETGVPGILMKNLFARESQFWPGLFEELDEAGLGQLTENGADTTLLWNPSFYAEFCPLVLDSRVCEQGYAQLDSGEQAMLRGALYSRAHAECENCPVGIDLTRAGFSVSVFAESLLAHCAQVGRIVTNVSGDAPGSVSQYEDLWRFTLASYNAGPGCLATAVTDTWLVQEPLDWSSVSARLEPACEGAVDYVRDVTGQ